MGCRRGPGPCWIVTRSDWLAGAWQQDGSDCLGGNGEASALQNFCNGGRSLNLPHHYDREGDEELMELRS
jgi:hypothetical protein